MKEDCKIITIKQRDYVTSKEAADALSVSNRRITQICEDGTFGTKIGGIWLIKKLDIKSYQKHRRQPGRPPLG